MINGIPQCYPSLTEKVGLTKNHGRSCASTACGAPFAYAVHLGRKGIMLISPP
jgi:hypothetical protein